MSQNNLAASDMQRHQEALSSCKYWVGLGFQFLAILAEPVLVLVTVLMVASDVTGGDLLNQGLFRAVYAIGQAVGVDAQMVAFVVLAAKAWDEQYKGKAVLFGVLASGLMFVAFTGVKLANYQQSFHTPILAALNAIGISPDAWVTLRSVVLVAVSATGAYLLYTPSAKLTQAKVNDKKEQLRLHTDLQNAQEEATWISRQERVKREREYAKYAKQEAFLNDSQGPTQQHTAAMNGTARR